MMFLQCVAEILCDVCQSVLEAKASPSWPAVFGENQ